MIFIGIDPGQTGAVAMICNGDVSTWDTPTTITKKGKKNRTEYLPAQMSGILSDMTGSPEVHAFIEKVHSMPGQGVASSFNFGTGFGLWLGILAGLQVPYTLVTPQAWKKALMQGMADKDAARIRAQELFPCAAGMLSRKKDIGRADALLIAEHGRRMLAAGTQR